MANSLKIKVNGLTHGVTASLDTPLLYVLHNELHLHGPRFGCGLAQCGACSVLLDGKEIRSCVTPVAAVSGKSITTLEGLPALWAAAARHLGGGPGAASAAAGLDRRAGAALRLLPERDDDPGCRPARDDEEPVRGSDPHGDERASVPLRDVSADPDRDPEGRGRDGKGRCVMTGLIPEKDFSRRSFIKGGGMMIVGIGAAGAMGGTAKAAGVPFDPFASPGPADPNSPRLVPDDPRGQHGLAPLGPDRARPGRDRRPDDHRRRRAEHGQLAARPHRVRHRRRRSRHRTPVTPAAARRSRRAARSCGWPPRRPTRRCSALASTNLGVPVGQLSVSKGVVSGGGKTVTYGQLIGDKLLNVKYAGTTLTAGQAPAKPVAQYTQVGIARPPRYDIPIIVNGSKVYAANVRVPGMIHGRIVRPRGQGAYGDGSTPVPLSIDQSSIAHIPGVQIVQKGNFLGVVAPKEYDAIQAAALLKVAWKDPPTISPVGNFWQGMRTFDSTGQIAAKYSVQQRERRLGDRRRREDRLR